VKTSIVDCQQTQWHSRPAYVLSNDQVELTHLTGGGQIVDLHFLAGDQVNPFWIPHWELRDPMEYRDDRDAAKYGPQGTGKLLSAIAGHSLCLEPFGVPSAEEIRAGATLHGEAGVCHWQAECAHGPETGEMRFTVPLPGDGLDFARTVSLRHGESAVRIRETVHNRRNADRLIQWQQHVTLAPPFVTREDCRIVLPGAHGVTFPDGYEGRELLARDAEFQWPLAPAANGGSVDLQIPFQKQGKGLIAGVQVDPHRDIAFVCAVNRRRNLVFGCVFRRNDFPWITLWEENRARTGVPWSGVEQASAIEFGVSPMPIGRAETLRRDEQFGTPVMANLSAESSISASYLMFLAHVSGGPQSIAGLACGDNELRLLNDSGGTISTVSVHGAHEFLTRQDDASSASQP